MTFSPSRSDLRHETVLRGDNCCQCHTAVVRTLARIPDDDLLIVSFKNSLYKVCLNIFDFFKRFNVTLIVSHGCPG